MGDKEFNKIGTGGYNNKSIENGNEIASILPFEVKQQILSGESEITYNGLIIKRLTQVAPKEEPTIEENSTVEEEPKPIKKPVKKAVKKKTK